MEDFVPYETVLKLEKKGYKGRTIRYHGHIYDVLKWLREECGIFISIYYDCKFKIWLYGVLIMKNGEFKLKDEKTYKTYELAALAGIKYVIDKLI